MEIAPGIDAEEWRKLNLDDDESPDWIRAAEIANKRIYGRYLDASEHLINLDDKNDPTKRAFGFAILAIDFAVVETIQAWKEKVIDTTGKSKKLVSSFLEEESEFKSYFPAVMDAKKFYKAFRCGIAHVTTTAPKTRVWSVGMLLFKSQGSYVLNRTEFHKKLKISFDNYLVIIRDGSSSVLRSNFKYVLDNIAKD